MRKVPGWEIWIGNAGTLADVRRICETVDAVVELADSEAMATLPRELIRCRFPISDGGENSTRLLQLAVDAIASLIQANIRTLICCSAGMSRSVCLTAAALATVNARPLTDVLAELCQNRPADVSPRLYQQVQNLFSNRSEG